MATKTPDDPARRKLLKASVGLGALAVIGGGAALAFNGSRTSAVYFDKDGLDALSPEDIIEVLKAGNQRFVDGQMIKYDYFAQKRATVNGQYPAAIVLSCIDSRAPAEIIMNTGIGDLFNTRIAGNVESVDVLGGMEYACKIVGTKVIMVMGHTRCGAVKGAIADARLGNLTELLAKIKPAIEQTQYDGVKSADNYDYVNAVARTNVGLVIENIRKFSPVLSDLEKEGKIKIVGSMYDISNGQLSFLS